MYKSIREFTDLEVWQRSKDLTIFIYKVTKNFPASEKYALVDQLKRAGISITSNIAEGFERDSYKDKIHFYNIACSSISEVKSQLIISNELGYINLDLFNEIFTLSVNCQKMLKGLIRKSREFI